MGPKKTKPNFGATNAIVARNIFDMRLERGWTQEQFNDIARQFKIDYTGSLTATENGHRRLTVNDLTTFAALLSVLSPLDLLELPDEDNAADLYQHYGTGKLLVEEIRAWLRGEFDTLGSPRHDEYLMMLQDQYEHNAQLYQDLYEEAIRDLENNDERRLDLNHGIHGTAFDIIKHYAQECDKYREKLEQVIERRRAINYGQGSK